MTSQQIAVVTGANRGLGLGVARQLAALDYAVILTARDPAKARAAATTFTRDGHKSRGDRATLIRYLEPYRSR